MINGLSDENKKLKYQNQIFESEIMKKEKMMKQIFPTKKKNLKKML